MGKISRHKTICEVLKDQAMTNLELLYDEMAGIEEYETKKIEQPKIEDGCVGCKNYKDKKCIHGLKHAIECIDNDYKFKEEQV